MRIHIHYTDLVVEQYPECEDHNEQVLSVFSIVCDEIDTKKLASFEVFFDNLDERFKMLDFAYDFTSIADELLDFEVFLKEKMEEFEFHFYELDRRVLFSINDDIVLFNIFDTMKTNHVVSGNISLKDLVQMIERLNDDFRELLHMCFPIALDIFEKENYVVRKNDSNT